MAKSMRLALVRFFLLVKNEMYWVAHGSKLLFAFDSEIINYRIFSKLTKAVYISRLKKQFFYIYLKIRKSFEMSNYSPAKTLIHSFE